MNLKELRERFPFKPFIHAMLDGKTVEVVSYPFPDDPRPVGIMVRTTPGDPETMTAIEAGRLEPIEQASPQASPPEECFLPPGWFGTIGGV